jgi:hypothetical protein
VFTVEIPLEGQPPVIEPETEDGAGHDAAEPRP